MLTIKDVKNSLMGDTDMFNNYMKIAKFKKLNKQSWRDLNSALFYSLLIQEILQEYDIYKLSLPCT